MAINGQYQPPFTITPKIIRLTADIGEAVGHISAMLDKSMELRLRKANRIRTIKGSLAIEGNTLTEEQITAILNGKRVIAPPREILEAQNAIAAYEHFDKWDSLNEKDLLEAHRIMMTGLVERAGAYRNSGVGVTDGTKIVHMAPPARQVQPLMYQLFDWLRTTEHHPLIAGSVFHFEFEFIHPFEDGNGRMGRLWQTLILSGWNPIFSQIPVESLIHEHQNDYYKSLQDGVKQTDCAPFIEFMLSMIHMTIADISSLQDAPHDAPQVKKLLQVMQGEMTREELQKAIHLTDRKSFRERYLAPALSEGYVEMTIPDKPNSRFQKYRLTGKGKQAAQEGRR